MKLAGIFRTVKTIAPVNPSAKAASLTATAVNPTAPAALTQLAAPAGGTGATAGAYDSAANRDLAIASINAARDDLIALRLEVVSYETAISALIVDVAAMRTQLIAAGIATA